MGNDEISRSFISIAEEGHLRAQVADLQRENEALRQERNRARVEARREYAPVVASERRLKEALEFYADPQSYDLCNQPAWWDKGKRACAALATPPTTALAEALAAEPSGWERLCSSHGQAPTFTSAEDQQYFQDSYAAAYQEAPTAEPTRAEEARER